MDTDFDLESLVHVEQSFYESGYEDGFAHGRIHGLIEGRALGREKGFEIWEELGFYEGFALTWRSLLAKQSREDDRTNQHIRQLLGSISRFPRVNPTALDASSELDIAKLMRQIRSRYKILCSSLGVRPRLRSADIDAMGEEKDSKSDEAVDMDMDDASSANDVLQALSQRVGPGSSIPVWKLDSTGAKKPVTNQDLSF